ncbi:unnamed protein product [Hapterophycus canaliculatus]
MRGRATAAAGERKTNRRCPRCGSSFLFIQRALLPRGSQHKPDGVHQRRATSPAVDDSDHCGKRVEMAMLALPDRPALVKCGYISFCACFGTLARLYTDDIGPVSNVALQGSFLANSLGSFALGVLTSSPDRETAPDAVYAGLTVGLCGSYTTYSGWNLRVARAALGEIPGAPSGAIVAVVAVVTSLAFFASCFAAGSDLMKHMASRGRTLQLRSILGGGGTLSGGGRDDLHAVLGMLGGVYALLVILLVVDDNWSRRIDWIACMLAPFGALTRFFLASRKLNNRVRGGAFPLGTFLANVLGSLAMASLFFTARKLSWTASGWNNVVVKAWQVGFFGSLTTMSTFMSEVVGHREAHSPPASYAYLAATAISALSAALIVGWALG